MKLSCTRKYISTQSKIKLWTSLLSSAVETESVSRFNMWLSNLVKSLSSSIKYKEADTISQLGKMAKRHYPVFMFVIKTPPCCCCVPYCLRYPISAFILFRYVSFQIHHSIISIQHWKTQYYYSCCVAFKSL